MASSRSISWRARGHDDVARLDVEVHDALLAQVVEDRAEVERHDLLTAPMLEPPSEAGMTLMSNF